ncbi:unnamed protein product [Didymodactylos carnosus]|uniref:Uncharacterized protein n=1 Tax=Didymodactylos carnosus TaxID=1234261 RepID=A0A815T4E0_9BILA|nr:unnamed protein product [Didymodactylos carnosus]CAF1498158.1 unnamed protein product [Didymodactylos carnosus]CAF3964155.1 unnamed protein product [Didymodactylos carnosus]CAF4360293.1 unnamed protein product [Didymodactylos carnosus]
METNYIIKDKRKQIVIKMFLKQKSSIIINVTKIFQIVFINDDDDDVGMAVDVRVENVAVQDDDDDVAVVAADKNVVVDDGGDVVGDDDGDDDDDVDRKALVPCF